MIVSSRPEERLSDFSNGQESSATHLVERVSRFVRTQWKHVGRTHREVLKRDPYYILGIIDTLGLQVPCRQGRTQDRGVHGRSRDAQHIDAEFAQLYPQGLAEIQLKRLGARVN